MAIRNVKEKDYEKLVELYKSFFPKHNIFQQDKKTIITYLKEQTVTGELLVNEEKGKIGAALFVVNFGQSVDGKHKLWKFRHFAFENEKVAAELLEEAEKRIQKKSNTVKIELTIAETETGINFYKFHGYRQEGALKNHYRYGETCFVLGKSFSS
ncbi:MAG: GNAT family N-acetyltransferase [Nanoarchaeota archaeon]